MKAYVVHCHPLDDSFVAAMRQRAVAGLRAAGYEVRVSDLYADGFRPELSAEEHALHLAPPDHKHSIAGYVANLQWCDTLVLVHPTWWSGQPAMLTGWFDRVWVNGVAFTMPAGSSRPRRGLTNIRRIVTVTSHGSSKLVNSVQGEPGKRVANRALRAMCSRRARTTWLALYGIDRCTEAQRLAFLDKVEGKLAKR